MNTVDKIIKDTRQIIVNSISDTLTKNLTSTAGDVGLTNEQVSHTLRLVQISIDEGFQRSVPFFQNAIKRYFEQ